MTSWTKDGSHSQISDIEEIFENNNALEINEIQGTYGYHLKNVYEYYPNGYPKIVRFYDQNDLTVFGKGMYFYTN